MTYWSLYPFDILFLSCNSVNGLDDLNSWDVVLGATSGCCGIYTIVLGNVNAHCDTFCIGAGLCCLDVWMHCVCVWIGASGMRQSLSGMHITTLQKFLLLLLWNVSLSWIKMEATGPWVWTNRHLTVYRSSKLNQTIAS